MDKDTSPRTTDESEIGEGAISRREVLALLGMLGLGGSMEAVGQDAVKVNPRSYRVVLENDKVRVLEYRSLPGFGVCGQGKHSHPAHLTIAMSDGRAKLVLDDGGRTVTVDQKSGHIFWEPAATHSAENISGRPMLAYMVEIKDKDWVPSSG